MSSFLVCVTCGGLEAAAEGANNMDTVAPGSTEMVVMDSRIDIILESLAATAGVRIEPSEGLRGRVQRRQFVGSVDDILAGLSDELDIEWFAYNGVYYVSHSSETVTRVVRLGDLSLQTAKTGLANAGLNLPALATRSMQNGEAIVLSGPTRLVALAEIILESITEKAGLPPQLARVRVRRAGTVTLEPIGGPEVSEEEASDTSTEPSQEELPG